jgi:DNA invertase Pin-like site-specific DNA recombinase
MTSKEVTTSQPVGYSYIRFSSGEQAKGDSVRRQSDGKAEDWCKRNEVTLDPGLTLHDRKDDGTSKGMSAFRGKHRTDDKAALARFLKDVESGKVPKGSYLIVEFLDRLTREEVLIAVNLISGILLKGVRIVQLLPVELVYTEKAQPHEIMLMIVELMRGHSESAAKSFRVGEQWALRKRRAREGKEQPPRKKDGRITRSMTSRLPAWIVDKGGKLVAIPERVKVIKRLYRMVLDGKGLYQIVKTLTAEGIPTWGEGKVKALHWGRPYVHKLLTSRTLLGELQTHTRGEPDGDPIIGYYPAVIDEDTWERVQSKLAGRREGPGRIGERVTNLFTGLLHDARSRGKMLIAWQTVGGTRVTALSMERTTVKGECSSRMLLWKAPRPPCRFPTLCGRKLYSPSYAR